MFFLKFIFFAFLFIFILGIVAVLFLKLAAHKLMSNINKQSKQDTNDTTFNNKTDKNKKGTSYKNKGEYIEFEEIKDEINS